jgi:carboxyl-terminal processing protease
MPSRLPLILLLLLGSTTGFSQDTPRLSSTLLQAAQLAYANKQYEQSAALYRQAIALTEDVDKAEAEYSLARCLALAGKHDEAFEVLRFAMRDGYDDSNGADRDRDLLSLHVDPEWQQILGLMSALRKQQDQRWGSTAFSSPSGTALSDSDKVAGISEFWAQAKFGFANFWHVPQLDWDEAYRDFLPKVLATKSTEEYYGVLERFCALLQDGHSNVYPPEYLNISPMPIRTRLVGNHLLIIGSRLANFDLQGLEPGDEILTIDDEPAIPWAKQHVEPFISASTQQDRDNRTFGTNLFEATEGTAFHIITSTPSGTHKSHIFKVPPYTPEVIAPVVFRMLPNNVAYVALNSFEDERAIKEWDKNWPEISKATSLVLDMRENTGGSSSVGYHILSSLLTRASQTELSTSTKWVATYRAWGAAELPVQFPIDTVSPDPIRHFSGSVAMLTSSRTFSAGEDMVVAFTQAHRGVLIGEPTAGSTGQPLVLKLPGGGTARICTKHDSFADGHEFIGEGVYPDIAIHITRDDIVAGRDPVLDKALSWIDAVGSPAKRNR